MSGKQLETRPDERSKGVNDFAREKHPGLGVARLALPQLKIEIEATTAA